MAFSISTLGVVSGNEHWWLKLISLLFNLVSYLPCIIMLKIFHIHDDFNDCYLAVGQLNNLSDKQIH